MDSLPLPATSKPVAFISGFTVLSIIYVLGKIIYQLYLHPLAKVPGTKLSALTRIPYIRHLLGGTIVNNDSELYEKYGEVVRFSPNGVSFISGESAWQDIYGFRTGKLKGHANMQKHPAWYAKPGNGVPSILIANDEDHTRGCRTLAHAFSAQALSEQEVLLQQYVDQLVDRLKQVTSSAKEPVDMVKWYNWATFNVISSLLFGEPFGCLQDLRTHKYIELLFQSLKGFSLFYVLHYFPWVK